jgi:hypothetical protein
MTGEAMTTEALSTPRSTRRGASRALDQGRVAA